MSTQSPGLVVVNDRPLRDVSDQALEELASRNQPPHIFQRGDRLVRVQHDGTGARVVGLGEHHLRGHLTRAADFVREVRKGRDIEYRHVSPPLDVVRDLLTVEDWPLPHLAGVISSPVMRPDGSILDCPGYDPKTRLYYAPANGFSLPAIPEHPDGLEVAQALDLLSEVFGDFPYEDQASRANAIALLLTPIVRPLITGRTPMALMDAPQAGTGKGLHVEMVSVIATGNTAAVTSAPRSDEEWRKRITTLLLGGQPIVLLDNVEGVLRSQSLAAALTAPAWQDRILGENRQVTLPVTTTWVVTGNNIRLGGDLPRRGYWVRLDAKTARPWQRHDFRHPDLGAYVHQHRPDLVAALMTLVRAWNAAGRPVDSVPRLGSYEEWSTTVGGVLAVAGVKDFLGNLDRLYDEADVETPMWEAFLAGWVQHFGSQAVSAAQVVAATELEGVLPDEVADAKPERRSRALGAALGQRVERRYGDRQLRVVRAGSQQRAVLWQAQEG